MWLQLIEISIILISSSRTNLSMRGFQCMFCWLKRPICISISSRTDSSGPLFATMLVLMKSMWYREHVDHTLEVLRDRGTGTGTR